MSRCCGPNICDVSRDEYICQARKLLPDFQDKIKEDSTFFAMSDALAGCFYDLVVMEACSLENEFNACTSEIYRDRWTEEFNLPIRCPLGPEISVELQSELLSLQLCLQVQIVGGATFNQALLDQIADVLGITYVVKVPTRDPRGVPVCEIIPMPPSNGQRCNPGGCNFEQAYYICITCAPSDAHIAVFECFIAELNPCHVRYCVLDETPKMEILQSCCDETVLADCLDLEMSIVQSCCDSTVEAG